MARVYSGTTGIAFTITLASIVDANGRKSAFIDNTSDRFEEVKITGVIRSGSAAPTVGTLYNFFLFTGDGATLPMVTDGITGGDVELGSSNIVENAPLMVTAVVTATTGKDFTFELIVDITGTNKWAIGFMNETGQTTDSTEANSFMAYIASKAA